MRGLVDASITAGSPLIRRSAPPSPSRGEGEVDGAYRIVGMENCAPSFVPDGQREVTVLVLV